MKDKLARGFLTAALLGLIGWPIVGLINASFAADGGGWSVDGWSEALRLATLPRAAWNTLVVSAGASSVAVVLCGIAAFLVARAGVPMPGAWRLILAVPMLFSQSVLAASWVSLADRHGGLLNVVAERAGFGAVLNVFGLTGMTLVVGACILSPIFLILEAAFARMDSGLEEVAAVNGAESAFIFRKVTAPLSMTYLLAAWIYGLLAAAAAFGPQAVIGIPAGLWTMTNLLFSRWNLYTASPASTAALAVMVIALGATAVPLLARLDAVRVFTPQRADARPWPMGKAGRAAALAYLIALSVPAALLPLGTILLRSFASYGLQARASVGEILRGLDGSAWRVVILDPTWRRALTDSAALSVVVAGAAGILGFGLAAFVVRPGARFGRVGEALATWPLACSGTALAAATMAAFGAAPFRWGALALLAATYLIKELPLAYLVARSAIAGTPRALEEAALSAGADEWGAARVALWPAARPALAAAAAAVFAASFREIESSTLLAAPGRETLGSSLYSAWAGGNLREMSAAALIGATAAAFGAGLIMWCGRPNWARRSMR